MHQEYFEGPGSCGPLGCDLSISQSADPQKPHHYIFTVLLFKYMYLGKKK